jgi:hypothetical protein
MTNHIIKTHKPDKDYDKGDDERGPKSQGSTQGRSSDTDYDDFATHLQHPDDADDDESVSDKRSYDNGGRASDVPNQDRTHENASG